MKNLIILILLLGLSSWGFAQQQTQSSFNYLNPYFINKSYAGLDTCTKVFFQQKNQYVGIDNAPANTSIMAHTRLRNNFGVGLGINRWSAGLLSNIDISAALSKHIQIDSDWSVSSSVNIGYARHSFRANDAIVFDNDNYLNQSQTASGSFYVDLGVLAQYQNIELGISAPRSFSSNPEFDVENENPEFDVENYLKVNAGYTFDYKEVWQFKPMLVYRTIPQHGDMLDIIASATYSNRIGAAVGYRTRSGLIASVNYNIMDLFTIGYGFDVNEQQVAGLGQGSHEILLGYKFCKALPEKPKAEPKQYFLGGEVKGEGSTLLTNATVTLKEIETGITSTTQPDSTGQYQFEVKPNSNYAVTVSNDHYETITNNITIDSLLTKQVNNMRLDHKQNEVTLRIVNAKDQTPVEGALIKTSTGRSVTSDENGTYNFVANKATLLDSMVIGVEVSKRKFNDTTATVVIQPGDYNAQTITVAIAPVVIKNAPKIVDNKIVVNPIYFAVNSDKISEQAAAELNKIIEYMNQDPELKIEVNSHTDCTGSAINNQKLSDKRAKACVEFIQAKISNPERITGKGFGESFSLSDCECKDCSTEEHAKNRRTEFIIKNKE